MGYIVYLFFIIFQLINIFTKCTANFQELDLEVQKNCIQRCPLQNRTDDGHFDIGCGKDCNIEQCTQGCKIWAQALETSCQAVCNGTADILPPKELYCVMGCNDAMTHYFTVLREKIGTLPAPALVADSLTATSLRLEWDFGGTRYAGVRYLVQWRYEVRGTSAAWAYCRNQTWGSQDTVLVDNLQPYTKYRFRVALLLPHYHGEPIVSEPSVVISTLPDGTPASPPFIVRAVPVDWSRISVSWEPGPFPHGPVLSYVLNISDNHHDGYKAIKDIPASENNFYMLNNLVPGRNYSISISMRNSVGEGPPATVYVSTPEEPTIKDTQKPILILGAHHTVIQQDAEMLDEPTVLYKTNDFIKGMAIHVSRQLLFISDSKGFIHQTSLKSFQRSKVLLTPQQLSAISAKFQPLDLSVDWLNDQLYILGEVTHKGSFTSNKVYQITRFGLDGGGLTVAVAGLLTKPHHIEVDPYNGYLFWVMDSPSKPGLYRLDLADISNGIKHDIQPDIILEQSNLGAFTVDHTKFHLLVPDHTNNTVFSVSFDGREVVDVRSNTQASQFLNVKSLAIANGLFYWTNGEGILAEEYHSLTKNYYHNTYPDVSGRSYLAVAINLPSCQPVPIPVNPPTVVQAILGPTLAKTSWQIPHLLGEQGKGAWQNWSYEIQVKDVQTSKVESHKNINATSYTIQGLKENTEYIIKAAAYTSSGTGPWSTEFRGKTLRKPQNGLPYPEILWSASEGLLKSDVTGEHVQTLIHKAIMKDYFVTNVAWYQEMVYFVSNSSQLFWYNMTSFQRGRLNEIDSVGSVAVDWIGKKLYWSNLKQQLINRANLNGSQMEPLPFLTIAKELYVDAINAYIYWSTVHSVESARLNGEERRIYHPSQIFTVYVMGLTLDYNKEMVYWIVRSSEGSTLYKQKMAQHLTIGEYYQGIKVANLQEPNMQGPLCYFDDRLLWLQDGKNAVIGDMNGQNAAVVSGRSLSGLSTVSILDPSFHDWKRTPNTSLVVIPDPVLRNTVKVVGTWDFFSIQWGKVSNVNYGQLFYEIRINDLSKEDTKRLTKEPFISYWKQVPPYTRLEITIRAFTYWGSAPPVRGELFSPPSTPSAPQNSRCYVTKTHLPFEEVNTSMVFRWNPPRQANGVITGYVVKFWLDENKKAVQESVVKPEELKYVVNNLTENKIYGFQVQAFTEMGNGPYSPITKCNTSEENPVPQILVAADDSVLLYDLDTHKPQKIIDQIIRPIEIQYMQNEKKIFWIDSKHDMYFSDLQNPKNMTKLAITSNGRGLTIDWIERVLYFVQNDIWLVGKGSSIYKINLNKVFEGNIRADHVLKSHAAIKDLKVSPFTRHLYWTEATSSGHNQLMQASLDDRKIKSFFNQNLNSFKRMRNQEYLPCNCPNYENVDGKINIDHSVKDRPKIIFTNSNSEIISADKHGCYCDQIWAHEGQKYFSFGTFSTDVNKIFWSNTVDESIYFLDKNTNQTFSEKCNGSNFIVFGNHVQPFPNPKCLIPKILSPFSLFDKGPNFLTLLLPEIQTDPECDNISIASVKYKIFYKKIIQNENISCPQNCTIVETYDRELKIENLEPYTKYFFALTTKNYFSNLKKVEDSIRKEVVFQTSAGTPTPPQNVSVIVLNPTMVEVKWLPPKELHGESVSYEINWKTETPVHGVRQTGEQILAFRDIESTNLNQIPKFRVGVLSNLTPNLSYLIWVRAKGENNESFSDSESLRVKTYPEPEDLILLNKTAKTLHVNWKLPSEVKNYVIQYKKMVSNTWKEITNITKDGFFVPNLLPKVKYLFRLNLKYQDYPDWFVWPKNQAGYVFETQGDRPSPPGIPIIGHVKGDVYQISWEAAKENGAQILMYNLEGMGFHNYRAKRSTNRTAWFNSAPFVEENEEQWVSYYNGTDTYWIISGLSDKLRYSFRVSALNENGWSDPSEESTIFDISSAAMLAERHDQMPIILGIAIPCFIVFCGIFIMAFIYCLRCKSQDKKQTQAMLISQTVTPDVELATLRELPRRENFIHNTNALYIPGLPSLEELALLPQINRDQITLINFLGRGAFGEVYEGKARIGENGAEIKVAVKTLRKGATEQEKIEFLQEAQLMSHFKHEHILQLLGVCLDAHFIIMELMQGGDLLTYLRSNRKPNSQNDGLTILDLLSMCVDVARGCKYLEEMHFVHRDLACRNCLVSSRDRQHRVVKIGDFGLARDIYKNDYYRKEGEGLLPVRWMAPESLVDGVFTCQSDVWAFGVLMWEIMTLGQQPYPARNNLEVLHYVKGGGRLEKPPYCPEELHKLMMLCWSYQPENRPTFKYSLEILEQLRDSVSDKSLTAAHIGNYISTVQNVACGVSNTAYFQDDNQNFDSGTSWKTILDDNSLKDKDSTPLVIKNHQNQSHLNLDQSSLNQNGLRTSADIPKYLEIICDSFSTENISSDGYEIPRSSFKKNIHKNRSRTLSNSSTVSNESASSNSKLNQNSENCVEKVQKCDSQKDSN